MNTIYQSLKLLHIAAGSLALLFGLTAILLRNNTKKHRPIGKIYFWSMTVIFLTAMFMATYKFNLFLFFINIFTFHAAFTAYRSLKLKKLHEGQKPEYQDWLMDALNATANVGLLIYGVYYALHYSIEGGIIPMVFGSIGLRNSWVNIRRLRGVIRHKNYWLLAHIGGMLGSYIGAITAFLVNNNQKLGIPDMVAWLGPAVFIVPFIIREVRFYEKKATLHQ